MPRVSSIAVTSRQLRLRHPFATSRDAAPRTTSTCVRATLTDDDGCVGIGEATAAPYVTGEDPESLVRDMERAGQAMVGLSIEDIHGLQAILRRLLPRSPSARAGLEMAFWRVGPGMQVVPLWYGFGSRLRELTTDTTISITDQAPAQIAEALAAGFTRLKFKVGNMGPRAEAERLCSLMGSAEGVALRVDANQAFTALQALEFIDRLLQAGLSLELVEQPVRAGRLADLDRVAQRSPVPIFADESVLTPEDASRVVARTAVHGINLKLMKSGLAPAFEIIIIAQTAGRRLMLGCMLESACGIAFSTAFAMGKGVFDYIDLDSHLLLDDPEADQWLCSDGPRLSLPGLPPVRKGRKHG